MSKSALIITGGNGYILKNFKFKKFSKKYDLFFIHSIKKKEFEISYKVNDLEFLNQKIIIGQYKEILLISFGSHLGGTDPGLYFKSVENLNLLLISLVKTKKEIFIYHASSFSIFNPSKNCSLFGFLLKDKEDLRGPYSYSKKQQNNVLREFEKKYNFIKCKIIHIGHVYDNKNKLIFRFISNSYKFKRIIFSFLYSPLKLVNPTSIDLIHSDIENFINKDKKVIKKYEEINLTDIESPISIFKIFMRQKILFISPIPFIICTFAPILLILLPKYSNISYILRKYLQMNNSIRY